MDTASISTNGRSATFATWCGATAIIRAIILWSIGNEIPEQNRADGWQVAKRLVDIFHEEDRTRPTTAAFNSDVAAIQNKLADQVDIPGFNYKPFNYEKILKDHPNWIIVGAETASAVSSRGVYHLPHREVREAPVTAAHEL